MNRRRTLFTNFALASAGLALIWSAAQAAGPNVGESLRDSRSETQSSSDGLGSTPMEPARFHSRVSEKLGDVSESFGDSELAPPIKSRTTQLPAIPAPRAASMLLPPPRLDRMPNDAPNSSRQAPASFATLANGEQIAAILRGPAPTSAANQPQRHGDAERSGSELATRSTKNNHK